MGNKNITKTKISMEQMCQTYIQCLNRLKTKKDVDINKDIDLSFVSLFISLFDTLDSNDKDYINTNYFFECKNPCPINKDLENKFANLLTYYNEQA